MKLQLNGFMFPYKDIRAWHFTPPESCFKSATRKEFKILIYFDNVINLNLFYLIYCVIEIYM